MEEVNTQLVFQLYLCIRMLCLNSHCILDTVSVRHREVRRRWCSEVWLGVANRLLQCYREPLMCSPSVGCSS